jgi:hypothetical protein
MDDFYFQLGFRAKFLALFCDAGVLHTGKVGYFGHIREFFASMTERCYRGSIPVDLASSELLNVAFRIGRVGTLPFPFLTCSETLTR